VAGVWWRWSCPSGNVGPSHRPRQALGPRQFVPLEGICRGERGGNSPAADGRWGRTIAESDGNRAPWFRQEEMAIAHRGGRGSAKWGAAAGVADGQDGGRRPPGPRRWEGPSVSGGLWWHRVRWSGGGGEYSGTRATEAIQNPAQGVQRRVLSRFVEEDRLRWVRSGDFTRHHVRNKALQSRLAGAGRGRFRVMLADGPGKRRSAWRRYRRASRGRSRVRRATFHKVPEPGQLGIQEVRARRVGAGPNKTQVRCRPMVTAGRSRSGSHGFGAKTPGVGRAGPAPPGHGARVLMPTRGSSGAAWLTVACGASNPVKPPRPRSWAS